MLLLIAEAVENLLLMLAVFSHPDAAPGIGLLAVATPLKFVSLAVSAVLGLLLLFYLLIRKLINS